MILQSKKIWIANQFIEAQIEIINQKITGIFSYEEKNFDIDYGANMIIPGFIDIHCHGAYSFDTNDANPDGLKYWCERLPEEGVTSFLPTTITQSKKILTEALANVANVAESDYKGAEILGIHFEGPYLDKKYKGAQPEPYIVNPSVEEFDEYQKRAKGLIKVITMACEHDSDYKLTSHLAQRGIVVSLGHSNATYEQSILAVAHGVKSMTHVFSAMSPFHHRKPGVIGAAFRFKDTYGEILCDGRHVNFNNVNTFFMEKGRNHAILVTDSLLSKGCPVGSKHYFGGQEIEVYPDGTSHITTGIKQLAGSTLRYDIALKLLIKEALVPIDYAINSTSLNQAQLLGVDDRKGKICVGYDADLVVLNSEYDIIKTYARGIGYL